MKRTGLTIPGRQISNPSPARDRLPGLHRSGAVRQVVGPGLVDRRPPRRSRADPVSERGRRHRRGRRSRATSAKDRVHLRLRRKDPRRRVARDDHSRRDARRERVLKLLTPSRARRSATRTCRAGGISWRSSRRRSPTRRRRMRRSGSMRSSERGAIRTRPPAGSFSKPPRRRTSCSGTHSARRRASMSCWRISRLSRSTCPE